MNNRSKIEVLPLAKIYQNCRLLELVLYNTSKETTYQCSIQ